MEKRLKTLEESVSLSEAEIITSEFSVISDQSEISNDAQQRILSSVMRKAEFEMKNNKTVKKTRRHSKRIITIAAAAALLTTGAISAGAYYMANRGTWNAVKYKFEGSDSVLTDSQINEAAETIERITAPNGMCEKNNFDELDITYEGTVADQDDMQMLFTIRRKDGKPFEEKEGYIWMYKYTEGLYTYEGDDTLYPNYHDLSAITLNDDGSLSATIDGYVFYSPDLDEYDYRLGFADLCYVPYGVQKMSSGDGAAFKLGDEAFMAWLKLLGDQDDDSPFGVMSFPNKLTGKEYDAAYADWQEKDSAYENALKESAEYYFSGEMLYCIPSASLKNSVPVFSKEQTGSDYEATISPQKITLKAKGLYDKAVKRYKGSDGTPPAIDVYLTDGSVRSFESVGGTGGADRLEDGSWQEYFTFEYIPDMPIKAEEIEYIQLSDVKINING